MAKHGRKRISRKISHLVKEEGRPQKQAVAIALSMARRGDLGKAAKRKAPRKQTSPAKFKDVAVKVFDHRFNGEPVKTRGPL